MDSWIQMVLTIVCAVIASSGFWAYISKRYEKKDVKTRMLVGLAHDRILFLGCDTLIGGISPVMNMKTSTSIYINLMKRWAETAPLNV